MLKNMNIGKKLYAGYSAVIVIMVVLITIAYVNFNSLNQANDMNIHTYEVINGAENMLTALVNMETAKGATALPEWKVSWSR